MRVLWIGIVREAHTNAPVQFARELNGVLREQVDIQIVKRFRRGNWETLRGRRGHPVDELCECRVGNQWRGVGTEVEIIDAQPARTHAELEFVRSLSPGETVAKLKTGRAAALHPIAVEATHRGEGRIGAGAL